MIYNGEIYTPQKGLDNVVSYAGESYFITADGRVYNYSFNDYEINWNLVFDEEVAVPEYLILNQ